MTIIRQHLIRGSPKSLVCFGFQVYSASNTPTTSISVSPVTLADFLAVISARLFTMVLSSNAQTVLAVVVILAIIMGVGAGHYAYRHRRTLDEEADPDRSSV